MQSDEGFDSGTLNTKMNSINVQQNSNRSIHFHFYVMRTVEFHTKWEMYENSNSCAEISLKFINKQVPTKEMHSYFSEQRNKDSESSIDKTEK